eukprot:scaffold4504_cov116-Isochrysis_galbana.AAC.7
MCTAGRLRLTLSASHANSVPSVGTAWPRARSEGETDLTPLTAKRKRTHVCVSGRTRPVYFTRYTGPILWYIET